MTKEEFEKMYAENTGLSINELNKRLIAVPCDCEEEGCKGWQMIIKNSDSLETEQ